MSFGVTRSAEPGDDSSRTQKKKTELIADQILNSQVNYPPPEEERMGTSLPLKLSLFFF